MRRLALRWLVVAAALLVMLLPAGCLSAASREAATLVQENMRAIPQLANAAARRTEQQGGQEEPKPVVGQPSVLEMVSRYEVPVGEKVEWTVALKNLDGRPLPNKVLLIFVNDQQVRRMRTDDNGEATIYLGNDLPVGSHHVRVEAVATTAYNTAIAEAEVSIRASQLRLITVPALPGIAFVFNGHTYLSDTNGVAEIQVEQSGEYSLEVLPVEESAGEEPVRIDFMRWEDNVFTPRRTVKISSDRDLYVGFTRSYPISLRFVDRSGAPVDTSRIMSVTIKSSTGTRYAVDPTGQEWRVANRIARLSNGMEPTEVQYAVENVIVDGTNVVNQNQQRFVVQGAAEWPIQMLLFSMKVRAKDALFGFPLGDGVNIRYPDGSVQFVAFDENEQLVITDLARGLYRLHVVGASGMAPETPVQVSRDQDVELKVLSNLDIALALGSGLAGVVALLLIGRPEPLLWLMPEQHAARIRRRRWAAIHAGDHGAWLDPMRESGSAERVSDGSAVQRYKKQDDPSLQRRYH